MKTCRMKRLVTIAVLLIVSWAICFLAVYGAVRLWERFFA